MPLWTKVATTAMSMARAEMRLPLRAESARPNNLRPVMNRIEARMYASWTTTSTPSTLLGAGSEHSQHAVGDQVTAYYVDGGKSDSQGGEKGPEDPVDRRSSDGSYQRDARDGVGARHQRRMQLRGHLAYQFQAQEHGQHEDEQ